MQISSIDTHRVQKLACKTASWNHLQESRVTKLGLVEAFHRYRAKQANSHWAVTAIAEDGSLVVSCWQHLFRKASSEVMRYEDRLSRFAFAVEVVFGCRAA